MDEHRMYSLIFKQNTYEKLWYVFPDHLFKNYLNGTLPEGSFLKSKDINDLIKYINNGEDIIKGKDQIHNKKNSIIKGSSSSKTGDSIPESTESA